MHDDGDSEQVPTPNGQWSVHLAGNDENNTSSNDDASGIKSVKWSAHEFIDHQKTAQWYAFVLLGGVVFAAIVYLLTKDAITSGIIIFAAAMLDVYAARKPRVITYKIDGTGLHIGSKFYHFNEFRSFAIMEEDAERCILFMPLRRFMPSFTIFYNRKDEKKITDIVAQKLPFDKYQNDLVERFMRRIKF